MSEQAVDLRSTWAVLRGHRRVLAIAGLIGAAMGVALLLLAPPAFTSTSAVLLPSAAQSGSGRAGAYEDDTQVLIASSTEVLSRAARSSKPELSPDEVGDRLTVEVPAPSILRITTAGATAGQAEDLAYAVAESLLSYLRETNTKLDQGRRVQLQNRFDTLSGSLATVNDEIGKATKRIAARSASPAAGAADAAALSELTAVRASTVLEIDALKRQLAGENGVGGPVGGGASVIQPASEGRRQGYINDALLHVLGGAAVFAMLALLIIIARNQRDPKLRSRDEIAAAVGIPVVVSLRARPRHTASGWADLLSSYRPGSVDGWALRQLIHGLAPADGKDRPAGDPFVLVVLSMSSDWGGLAIGPQIATYLASHGISTQLVAAQQHPSATTLWAACARTPEGGPDALSVTTALENATTRVDVSVRLVVLDREAPEAPTMPTEGVTTILAVSSASVTRKNLADAVVAADRVGLVVQGIVVANPDPLDRTSGRLTPLEMPDPTVPRAIPITSRSAPKAPSNPNGQRRESTGGQG